MHEFPETRDSLLLQIRDSSDRQSWYEFAAIYRPVVYRMARRRGMQDADAQDLAQRVLLAVVGAIGDWKADPDRPRFRNWLSRVARNEIIDAFRRARPDAGRGGTTVLLQLAEEPELTDAELEREQQRELFRWAAKQIRAEFTEDTWLAFWKTTVEANSIEDIASELGKSVGAIYTARSRVMKRLQEMVKSAE